MRRRKRAGSRGLLGFSFPLPAFFVALLISTGLLLRGFDSTVGQATSCILNASLLIALLVRAPPSAHFWRRAAPALLLVSAAILWAVVATLSPDGIFPDYAVGKLLSLFSGVAALLCGALLTRRRRRRRALLDWLLILNSLILAMGLVVRQVGTNGIFSYWEIERGERYLGLIGNANVTAAIAASFTILAFARLTWSETPFNWKLGKRAGAAVYLAMFVMNLVVVIVAASRFTAVLLAGVLSLYAFDWMLRRRGRQAHRRLMTIAVGALILLVVGQLSGQLRDRFGLVSAGGEDRVATWSHLADVAAASPLYGYGLGSFPSVNAHFLTTARYAEANWAVNSAHNLVLQLMLQAGAPYLLLILAAIGWGWHQVARALRRRWTREDVVIVAILGQILGCSMVDIVLDMPAPLTLTLFLLGLLWGQALDRSEISVPLAGLEPADHVPTVRR